MGRPRPQIAQAKRGAGVACLGVGCRVCYTQAGATLGARHRGAGGPRYRGEAISGDGLNSVSWAVMPPSRTTTLYLDTEFSAFGEAELLSLAMVSADSGPSLYIVIADPDPACGLSEFVRAVVLPLLPRHAPDVLTRAHAARRIDAFIGACRDDPDDPVHIVFDAPIDWQLLIELWPSIPGPPGWASANRIQGRLLQDHIPAQQLDRLAGFIDAYHQQFGEPHHALMDARALQWAHQQLRGSA